MSDDKYTPEWSWEPKPDITAYELALCMPALSDKFRYSKGRNVEELPARARRHFRRYGEFAKPPR